MGKHKVLIAEDESMVSEMLQGLLEDLGYEIVGQAMDGQQAVEMTQSLRPDVVLMDIAMPEMNGIEATYRIQEQCPTPVVMLTAYENHGSVKQASEAGAGAYLVKPPQASEMERAITVAVARFDYMVALKLRVAELEAVRQASLRLTSSLDLQPVLETILEQAHKLSSTDRTHIFLYDGETLTFGAALGPKGADIGPVSAPRPNGLTYTVARSGKRLVISDVNRHPLFEGWQWGGAIVGLPLHVGKKVIGVMNCSFEKPRLFDEHTLYVLELLAVQAAIAIQNAHLHEQAQRYATELEQRVAARTRELKAANERLKELDRLKSKFVSDVTHELRTPVTNLSLYLDLLERGKPEKRAHYEAVIKEQTALLMRLIQDVLDLSRMDLGDKQLDLTAMDLNEVTAQAVDAHQSRAEAAGLTLRFEPEENLPPVQADKAQLRRVINSLLNNAILYTSEGHVHVSTHWVAQLGQICLTVQDTGMGIMPQDLPHIFERFYRGQGVGSSNIPGIGLSLPIAQEIVNLHNGRLKVESEVGKGSTFRLWLPSSNAPLVKPPPASPSTPPAKS